MDQPPSLQPLVYFHIDRGYTFRQIKQLLIENKWTESLEHFFLQITDLIFVVAILKILYNKW